MKRISFIGLSLLLLVVPSIQSAVKTAGLPQSTSVDTGNYTSKSFFSVPPQFQTFSPEKDSFFRDSFILRDEDEDRKSRFEVAVFGGRSNSACDLAQYFFPFGRNEILIAGDNAANADNRDVSAVHLNIEYENKEFESCVSIKPRQTVIGAGFHYRQWIYEWNDCGFWIDLSFPVVRVKNDLCFCESITNSGDTLVGTRVANATEAFNQADWCYGKMSCNALCETGVADVEVKVGWESCHTDTCHLESYVGFVAPTGTRPKGCYVFEPIVGNNRHWGLMTGGTMAMTCWTKDDDKRLVYIIDINRRYLFKSKEVRSFDLVDKSWGRYMEVYANKAAAQTAFDNAGSVADGDHGSPGINVFTRCVDVKPRFSTTCNSAFLFAWGDFHFEFGYNLYAREKEEIYFCNGFDTGDNAPALVSATQSGTMTNARTINKNFNGSGTDIAIADYADAALSICDLDPDSGAHPALFGHTFYGALGYSYTEWDYPIHVGLGGSYEFSGNNSMMDRWLVWGKLGVGF